MTPTELILPLIEKLTGQQRPLDRDVPGYITELLEESGSGIGHSQFNELLLTLGYDRVSYTFFQWLVEEKTECLPGEPGASFRSIANIEAGVVRFCKLGMLQFGNVKFAFKRLSSTSNTNEFLKELNEVAKIPESEYKNRHAPIHPISPIAGDKTYYLGHIIGRDIEQRAEANKDDSAAQQERDALRATVAIGKKNFDAYLVSDHLDVYVATSMRERHEYQMVHKLTREIFSNTLLADLKLRYFDPTQAYCADPFDKGLAEGLMLKRAKCTIYFVQENDTFGKDSELASTLAQGKPVIAYVPEPQTSYAETLIADLKEAYPDKEVRELVLAQMRLFSPNTAWESKPNIRQWIDKPETFDLPAATSLLQSAIDEKYNYRYQMLKDVHPLRIQVNLSTGVANGLLVVRHVDQCAALVRCIMLREWDFDILVGDRKDGTKSQYLREKLSQCIFRVVTGDKLLTNSFWNFYLDPR